MRIAFVGHIYHKTTGSSDFFIKEILTRFDADIRYFWDESADDPKNIIDIENIKKLNPDSIVIWQSEAILLKIIRSCSRNFLDRVTFVPMFDSVKQVEKGFWEEVKGIKMLNFCYEVEKICNTKKINSFYLQYMPSIDCQKRVLNFKTAFFWQRRRDINFGYIYPLLKQLKIKKVLFHHAPDPIPNNEIILPSLIDRIKFKIIVSNWFKSKADFTNHIDRAGFFIAPRVYEGIGMGFLEAMSRGQIVVAPDHPTMNEYIQNGINGLLYDTNERKITVDKNTDLNKISFNACETAVYIRNKYSNIIQHAVKFALNHNDRDSCARNLPYTAKNSESSQLTIIIVVKNNISGLSKTIASSRSQSNKFFKILVIDGGSTDGTIEFLTKENLHFISENDSGVYDAMNKGVKLAETRWVLFFNSGDEFLHDGVIDEMTEDVGHDDGIAFILGAHIYKDLESGTKNLYRPLSYKIIDEKLKSGSVDWSLISGIPCHQATITRRELLLKYPYDLGYKIAADHDFYYKMIAKGYKNVIKNTIILNYESGGYSSINKDACWSEWRSILLNYTKKTPEIFINGSCSVGEEIYSTRVEEKIPINESINQSIQCEKTNLHGFDVYINSGNPYPEMIKEHIYFNSPLVEMINQAFITKSKKLNIIDVGASFGDTVFLLQQRTPFAIGNVFCIEGDSDFYSLLCKNISQFPNIRALNALLSNENGFIPDLIKHHPGTASATGREVRACKTLDFFIDFFSCDIDILKIDVDGYDGAVLLGATEILSKLQPWVIFEWHPALIKNAKQDFFAPFLALSNANYKQFLWFNNTGCFSHFSSIPNRNDVSLFVDYLLKVNHRRDQHFDVIALPESCAGIDVELAAMKFARKLAKL
jgi:FkbM family methyltransferase